MTSRRRGISRKHRLTIAISRGTLSTALGCVALGAGWSWPAHAAEPVQSQALQRHSIPAGPLGDVLSQYATAVGVQLVFEPATLAGMRSPGLEGRYTLEEGFRRLLRGSDHQLIDQGRGTYSLKRIAHTPSQDISGTTALPPVMVQAKRSTEEATGPVGGFVAKRSSTATKTDTALLETPRSISVVTREQIEAQGASNILDTLGYTPGVYTTSLPSTLDSSLVWLRGIRSQLGETYYRDGMRSASSTSYNYRSPEPYGLERIEVLRGPASVMFGQNAPGGIINLVSKQPTDTPQRQVEVQAGSFNRKQLAADLAGPLDEAGVWAYRLIGLKRDSDSQIDHARDDRDYLSGALTWRPTVNTSITFQGEYQRNDGLTYVLLPAEGTALPNPNGQLPTSRTLSSNNRETFETRTVGYLLDHRFNEQWKVRQNLRFTEHDATRFLTNWPGYQSGQQRVIDMYPFLGTASGHQWTVDNQLLGKLSHGVVSHSMVFGIDYLSAKADTGSGIDSTTLDLYAPVYTPLGRPQISERVHTAQDQLGLYAQDQIKIDQRWIVSLGARKDWAKLSQDTTDVASNSTTPASQKDQAITGQAGLLYLFDSGWAPYASYSTSFTPIIGTDFNGREFKPEKGKQLEAGIKYQPKDGNSLITLSVFDLRKRNATTPDLDPSHPDSFVQKGEVRSRGIELEGKAELSSHLRVLGSLTYLKPEVTRSNDSDLGKQVPAVARNTGSAWLDYTFGQKALRGMSVGVGVRHVGSVYGDSLNTFSAPSFTLVDFAMRYDLGKANPPLRGFELALNVSNLSDKAYVGNCEYTCTYGARRNALMTLRYRW